MADKEQSIGAIWSRMAKSGTEYFSGVIEIDGQKKQIVIFKNNYKKDEKHPDYRIFESKPRDSSQVVDDPSDIPF